MEGGGGISCHPFTFTASWLIILLPLPLLFSPFFRDAGLLEEMYTAASFYRLNSLRRAIEVKFGTLRKARRDGGGQSEGESILKVKRDGRNGELGKSLPDPFSFTNRF